MKVTFRFSLFRKFILRTWRVLSSVSVSSDVVTKSHSLISFIWSIFVFDVFLYVSLTLILLLCKIVGGFRSDNRDYDFSRCSNQLMYEKRTLRISTTNGGNLIIVVVGEVIKTSPVQITYATESLLNGRIFGSR